MRRESGERKSCGPGSLVQHKVRAEGRRSVAQLVNGFGSHHFPQAVKARGVWLWMLEAKGGWPPNKSIKQFFSLGIPVATAVAICASRYTHTSLKNG